MAKKNIFNGNFSGCAKGDIYPTQYVAGDVVPNELEAAAEALEVIETDAKKAEALVKARAKQIAKADKEEADADE